MKVHLQRKGEQVRSREERREQVRCVEHCSGTWKREDG